MSSERAETAALLQLRPFRAVRFAVRGDLGALICPPYDVIDDAARLALLARDPHNIVRIVLPDADDDSSLDRYQCASTLFDTWLADGTLAVDSIPALYVYQQRRGEHVLQRGLLGAVTWQPLDAGVILPHENVRPGPVQDRLALMRALQANPEPIFLLYDGGGAASQHANLATQKPPIAFANTGDGIRHDVWAITDQASITEIGGDLAVRTAMIADGHHRYTTYGYLRDEFGGPNHEGGPWDSGLALLVDGSAAAPDVRAIHRVVPGVSMAEIARKLGDVFTIDPVPPIDVGLALKQLSDTASPSYLISDGSTFALARDPSRARLAAAKPTNHGDAWWHLDASVASVLVMEQILGVRDIGEQVRAEHDPDAALRLAQQTHGTALLLKPAPITGISAVAQAGEVMPRKSTLFMPKPCSGMVMRAFRFDR